MLMELEAGAVSARVQMAKLIGLAIMPTLVHLWRVWMVFQELVISPMTPNGPTAKWCAAKRRKKSTQISVFRTRKSGNSRSVIQEKCWMPLGIWISTKKEFMGSALLQIRLSIQWSQVHLGSEIMVECAHAGILKTSNHSVEYSGSALFHHFRELRSVTIHDFCIFSGIFRLKWWLSAHTRAKMVISLEKAQNRPWKCFWGLWVHFLGAWWCQTPQEVLGHLDLGQRELLQDWPSSQNSSFSHESGERA